MSVKLREYCHYEMSFLDPFDSFVIENKFSKTFTQASKTRRKFQWKLCKAKRVFSNIQSPTGNPAINLTANFFRKNVSWQTPFPLLTYLAKTLCIYVPFTTFVRYPNNTVCIVLRSFRLICLYIVISKSVEQHFSVCLPCILVAFMLQGNWCIIFKFSDHFISLAIYP